MTQNTIYVYSSAIGVFQCQESALDLLQWSRPVADPEIWNRGGKG